MNEKVSARTVARDRDYLSRIFRRFVAFEIIQNVKVHKYK
jgi:hypothetical protein